jgi:hypothetical protein
MTLTEGVSTVESTYTLYLYFAGMDLLLYDWKCCWVQGIVPCDCWGACEELGQAKISKQAEKWAQVACTHHIP